MKFDRTQFTRVTKRMVEATGYLELGMTEHALDRLNGLGDLGPLEPQVELMRRAAQHIHERGHDTAMPQMAPNRSWIRKSAADPRPNTPLL